MRFNRFIWDIYIQSQRGQKAVERFSHLTDDFIEPWCRILDISINEEFKDQYPSENISFDLPKLIRDMLSGSKFKNLEEATRYYQDVLVQEGIALETPDKKGKWNVVTTLGEYPEDWYDYVAGISLGLYLAQPDFFLPYNFRSKFNQLEEIHQIFNIPLPPIPGKYKKEERSFYYLSINQAWQEFRNLHELSSAEMCAFLYDFAIQFTTLMDASDLPDPSKVWLVTGGSWDFETVENATHDTVSYWGGNSAVRRGDILMMYIVSPHKYIHSIWRACSDGFIDPFFHYHSSIWISGRIKTQPVYFKELKQHLLLSQKPAVKGHFQGASGKTPFTVEEYEAILEIMENKGQDLSVLPKIPWSKELLQVDLQDERDVEVHLIEPFLKRLGYNQSDWIRQMPVRMGRGERNYPDYVIGAKEKRGEESAKMVLESKYQLSAHREFIDSFYQTKSYALRLQSKIMIMAAKEGVWVFPQTEGTFELKKVTHKTWSELNHPDGFHTVLSLIGRGNVLD